jgi:hypothetical protein
MRAIELLPGLVEQGVVAFSAYAAWAWYRSAKASVLVAKEASDRITQAIADQINFGMLVPQ